MTQEAKVTLLTIERYLSKNPRVSLAQALIHLHIIQFEEGDDSPDHPPVPRNISRDNDTQIMGRVIKSHPFRKQPLSSLKNRNRL